MWRSVPFFKRILIFFLNNGKILSRFKREMLQNKSSFNMKNQEGTKMNIVGLVKRLLLVLGKRQW